MDRGCCKVWSQVNSRDLPWAEEGKERGPPVQGEGRQVDRVALNARELNQETWEGAPVSTEDGLSLETNSPSPTLSGRKG